MHNFYRTDFFEQQADFSQLLETSQPRFQRQSIAMPWLRSMAATALAVSGAFSVPPSPAMSDARVAPRVVLAQGEKDGLPLLSNEMLDRAHAVRSFFSVLPTDDSDDPDYGF
jgi:hypothetical protein